MPFDAVVIGGSFAGLEATTYLARALRTVCVIDAGLPRNRFAEHSHGFLSRDGAAPGEILGAARKQLGAYPSVQLRSGTATSAERIDGGFRVHLDDGAAIEGKRLILAFGVSDVLPDIPGLRERWGKTVNHCPYCHGFEFAGKSLGVLNLVEHSHHQARIIREWGPTTFFLNGGSLEPEDARALEAVGTDFVFGKVSALVGDGTALDGVQVEGGGVVAIHALYIAPPTQLNSAIAEQLGCAIDQGPLGPTVRTDDMMATSVPGVFAAGDITRSMHSITLATADGLMAGTAAHRSLFMES